MEYTDEYIEELITCPKEIINPPPKKMKKDRGHWQKSFGLESEDGEHQFTVFIRYNDEFNENFSVGLVYNPLDQRGNIHLFRCNGPHGGTKEWDHHDKPHTHTAKAEFVNQELNSETTIEITNRYNSWQEAVKYFIERVNIKNAARYFPPPQNDLFE